MKKPTDITSGNKKGIVDFYLFNVIHSRQIQGVRHRTFAIGTLQEGS